MRFGTLAPVVGPPASRPTRSGTVAATAMAPPEAARNPDPMPRPGPGAPVEVDGSDPPLARVAYLGFDACDAAIVADLVAEGELPAFARVLAEGASVPTLGPPGVFSSAIWATFATARTPDHHRYYCWSEVEAGGYATRDTDPSEIVGTPFFETVSRSGRRVAVLDVPHTRPVEGLNGAMLSEWGCHDRHGVTASWPPGLVAELNDRFGPHPVGCHAGPGFAQFDPSDYLHRAGDRRTADEVERLFADLCEGHERKRALSLSMLDEGGWDLFAVVFSEAHCTGHQLWHAHDPTHPWHDPEPAGRLGSPIVEMYRRLDATLAAHLERLGPDPTVFVHLSHGMGPHYDGTDILEHVLRLLDKPAEAGAGGGRVADVLDRVDPALRSVPVRAVGRLPVAQRAWQRWLQRQPRRTFSDLPPESVDPADRAGRRWFAIPNNTVIGAVRFNVAGREPSGIVERGPELDALADELAGVLAELVNIDTGEPLVLGVTRGEAMHEFGDDDPFPDVLVEWNRTAPIERVWSPRFGAIEVPRTHWRTGDHTPHGLFVAMGAGIEPGARGGPVDVEHLAPTICASLGVTLAEVDGRPIAGLVPGNGGLAPHPTWLVPPPAASAIREKTVSAFDRLRQLARDAAQERARSWLGLPELTRRVSDVEGSVVVLADEELDTRRAATWATDLAGDGHARAEAAQTYAGYVNNTVEVMAGALEELSGRVAGVTDRSDAIDHLDARTRRLMRLAQIDTTMRWIELIDQPEDLLISVVMPTYNRAVLLPRSIGSLLAQEYGNWELVVVDDGSTDDTQRVLDTFDDPRISRLRSEHVGCSGARNVALAAVRGDVVAYLDDDNVMHPRWLTSVAWAFSQRPDVDVVCGARVVDDYDRLHDWQDSGGMPWIQYEPFDRDRLELGNTADIGVMAHRSGLAEMHFDEDLVVYGDWDLLLRLTREKPPLELPAIAIAYATDTPERLSTGDQTADHDLVQTKLRAATAADSTHPEAT